MLLKIHVFTFYLQIRISLLSSSLSEALVRRELGHPLTCKWEGFVVLVALKKLFCSNTFEMIIKRKIIIQEKLYKLWWASLLPYVISNSHGFFRKNCWVIKKKEVSCNGFTLNSKVRAGGTACQNYRCDAGEELPEDLLLCGIPSFISWGLRVGMTHPPNGPGTALLPRLLPACRTSLRLLQIF